MTASAPRRLSFSNFSPEEDVAMTRAPAAFTNCSANSDTLPLDDAGPGRAFEVRVEPGIEDFRRRRFDGPLDLDAHCFDVPDVHCDFLFAANTSARASRRSLQNCS